MPHTIDDLKQIAAAYETAPEKSVAAMVELSRRFSQGRDGAEKDWQEALLWAEEAAKKDSPDGYFEISSIIGGACIEEQDIHQDETRYHDCRTV